MPKGQEFSFELKTVFFRVINFVEREKAGIIIPLYKPTARLIEMLGISEASIGRLQKELAEQQQKHNEDTKEEPIRPRTRTQSASVSTRPHRKRRWSSVVFTDSLPTIPPPIRPRKKGSSGRPPFVLSEVAEDTIRYHFHLILAEKCYPTIVNLLASIHDEYPDFPIQSKTTLWRHLKRLGFSYKQTNKVPVPLESISFVAQRAAYFRRLDELRGASTNLYYHDETWCNVGEEKRSVWLDEAKEGRIRKQDGKGKRLAISAMINETGFHKDTVDLFTCDVDHSMVS
jgi:hypothetical protein